jgi:TPR repeat protein
MVSIYEIGRYEYNNQRYTEAMLWFKVPDVENLAMAQASIGTLYSRGNGVVLDYHIALNWYLKAAKQHYEPVFSDIGTLFYYGRGVPRDRHKAKEWFYKGGEYSTENEPSDDESDPRLKDTEKRKGVKMLPTLELI